MSSSDDVELGNTHVIGMGCNWDLIRPYIFANQTIHFLIFSLKKKHITHMHSYMGHIACHLESLDSSAGKKGKKANKGSIHLHRSISSDHSVSVV